MNGQWMKENLHIFFIYIDLYDGVRIGRKLEQLAAERVNEQGARDNLSFQRLKGRVSIVLSTLRFRLSDLAIEHGRLSQA